MDTSNFCFTLARAAALAFPLHLLAHPAEGQLVASGNQFWSQASDGIAGVEEAGDVFGSELASGDFNADGFEDLAIGVPGEAIGAALGAGAVHVLNGTPDGLGSAGDQFWFQGDSGLPGAPEEGDQFGSSLAAGDFDGDGTDDLAIGANGEGIGSIGFTGAVVVLYGSRGGGLSGTGSQLWHQDSPGIQGENESGDRFGFSLVACDFDGDGVDDLAIGAPGLSRSPGAVSVLFGSPGIGLSSAGNQIWNQDSPGVPGVSENGDGFGYSLACASFDGDGYSDLAIGIPREDLGAEVDAGAVQILYGSASGLADIGGFWRQGSDGLQGTPEGSDHFGLSLAAGDFDGDRFDDLAIGVPLEDLAAVGDAGAVHVLYGAPAGLSATGNQLWHQDTPGIAGVAEASDVFGLALAAGRFAGSAYDALAIGVSREELTGIEEAGAVHVLYGAGGRLGAAGSQFWHQDVPGVGGVAEYVDRFGSALLAGDFDGSGADDLAIGVPSEDIGAISRAGGVNVLYGSGGGEVFTGLFADGFESGTTGAWSATD